jgi:hypothetical protein
MVPVTSLADRMVICLEWGTRTVSTRENLQSLWETDSSELVQPFEKLLTEAGLFAFLAHRALGDHPAISELLDAVAACGDSLDRIYEIVCSRPYLWPSVGAIWVMLDQLSTGDQLKRKRLRQLWETEHPVQPTERVPYRLIDEAWVRMVAQGRTELQLTPPDLQACTSFHNVTGALFMTTADLYAFTHTPMYLTDFGSAGRTELAPGWVGALAASRLLINDLDLAGELAMVDVLTQSRPDVGTLAVIAALSTILDQLGCVPAPSFRSESYRAATRPSDYLFFHSYHSTFVYGMLCATLAVINENDEKVTTLISSHPAVTFPQEWSGHRLGIAETSDQVVHTFKAWRAIARERGVELEIEPLLRTVLDAYLIDATRENRIQDVLSLLGMQTVAGSSVIDQAAREMLTLRARLAGDSTFSMQVGAEGTPDVYSATDHEYRRRDIRGGTG